MNLSTDGRTKIEGYEGYHDRLPDGSCRAYQRTYNGKKDKWTLGFGCTEGVYEGLIWTREQADDAFSKELAKFEAAVTRLVTVDLNQNQFDALVSFAYNCGIAGLQSSTLLKKLNKGDYKGAAGQFQYWNHVNGKPVSGLTQRRASEANLFMKPVAPEPLPAMPQTVEKATEPPSGKTVAIAATASTATVAQFMPSVSDLDKIVSTGQRVRGLTEQAGDLGSWLMHSAATPWAVLAILAGVYFIWRSSGAGGSRSTVNDSSN